MVVLSRWRWQDAGNQGSDIRRSRHRKRAHSSRGIPGGASGLISQTSSDCSESTSVFEPCQGSFHAAGIPSAEPEPSAARLLSLIRGGDGTIVTEPQRGVIATMRVFNAAKVLLYLPFAFVGEMFRSALG